MIRMLLIGYLYGIRSERRLVEEVASNPPTIGMIRATLRARCANLDQLDKAAGLAALLPGETQQPPKGLCHIAKLST
jgi:Transposase domain (DUF772)